MSTRKKAPAKPRKRQPAKRRPVRAKRSSFAWPTMPQLEQRHFDLIGLGLVALASFLAFVFYIGWDGGKIGAGLKDGFCLLFGKAGYLAPVIIFGVGAVMVIKPMVSTIRGWGSGAAALFGALTLGFAAGSFGLGPERLDPAGTFSAPQLKIHGGAVGEGAYYVTKTLVSQFGTNILFLFLLAVGVLLLTGASIAGLVQAAHQGIADTRERVSSVRAIQEPEFDEPVTAVRTRRKPSPVEVDPWEAEDDDEPPLPPDVEPVVRATHVEAPLPWYEREDEEPKVIEDEPPVDESEVHNAPEEGVDGRARQAEARAHRGRPDPDGQVALDGHRGRRLRLRAAEPEPAQALAQHPGRGPRGRGAHRPPARRGAQPLRRRVEDRRHRLRPAHHALRGPPRARA